MTTAEAQKEAKKRRESETDTHSREFWNVVIRTLGSWQRYSDEIYKRAYDRGKRAGYDEGWQRGNQHEREKVKRWEQ